MSKLNNICQSYGCSNKANYGFLGSSSDGGLLHTLGAPSQGKTYCRKHKSNGMIDFSRICEFEGCFIRSSYGFPESSIPGSRDIKITHCVRHKLDGMKCRARLTCEFEGCLIQPSYGFPEFSTGQPQRRTHCQKHKIIGMKSFQKLCQFEGCLIVPSYGIPGSSPQRKTHCRKHRTVEMTSFNYMCEIKDCSIRAGYGFSGKKRTRCASHKLDGMIHWRQRKSDIISNRHY